MIGWLKRIWAAVTRRKRGLSTSDRLRWELEEELRRRKR